jgi:hypothetical protein
VVSFTHRPGKTPRYPLDRRLGGPQSQSERGGEEKSLVRRPKLCMHLFFPMRATYAAHLILDSITLCLVNITNYETPHHVILSVTVLLGLSLLSKYEGVSKIFRIESITK